MRNDHWKRVLVTGTDVDEMNVQPVDLRYELWQGVQFRFRLPPIVIFRPIAREFLHRRKWHALRRICDGFLFRPLRRGDPPAKLVNRFLRHVDFWERADRRIRGRARLGGALGLCAGPGRLLREHTSGRSQRHHCRKERDEESREQDEST